MKTTTRRELLLGGAAAGAAALALPSPFSPFGGLDVFAQSAQQKLSADPILAELTRQFHKVYQGLTAPKPTGDAKQIASLLSMMSAWAKANDLTGQVKNVLADANAEPNTGNAFVRQMAAFDRIADAKARGLVVPPGFRNLTVRDHAMGIARVNAGWSAERAWGQLANIIDQKADVLNRWIRRDDSLIFSKAALQNPQDVETSGGCTEYQIGDGGGEVHYFECNFVATYVPTNQPVFSYQTGVMSREECVTLKINIATSNAFYSLICLVLIEFCALGIAAMFINALLDAIFCTM